MLEARKSILKKYPSYFLDVFPNARRYEGRS